MTAKVHYEGVTITAYCIVWLASIFKQYQKGRRCRVKHQIVF